MLFDYVGVAAASIGKFTVVELLKK